ncbi:hypothetical protein QVD17_20704 [Tagetes erecta]|uniref:Uncharacterized protein n=1 Tax=Tagetes erecta TaxID=13708 RepID=A0AAD8KM64_TARER|nr:hypothetical protein QVD17_20704 [Tagetes erecta]
MANQTTLEPWHNLNGKVVMVTGASSGLGRDFCLDLAQAGCRIVAAARRIDRLVSLCDEINRLEPTDNIRAVMLELDVCAKGSVIEASVKQAWDAFGRIDCLINNAGVRGNVRNLFKLSEEEWDNTMRTNLSGTWLVSKYVCAYMCDAKMGGSIINISSISGVNRVNGPGAHAYASSKTGVNALTRVMATEVGKYNIRVNSINPGLFRSEITEALMDKKWINNVAQKVVPLTTFGKTNPALTSLVRYLIHDLSEYVSGSVFIVDAGLSLVGVPIFSSL